MRCATYFSARKHAPILMMMIVQIRANLSLLLKEVARRVN
jgi:hypothetical protein